MNLKRQLAATVLLGTGVGLVGCQAPTGGLAFWNKGDSSAVASSAPDVSKQRYNGLSQEFAGNARPAGQASSGAAALGGPKPGADDNFLVASWKKTTGAVAGVFAADPKTEDMDDPLRLDQPSKKPGPEIYVAAARLLEQQNKLSEAQVQYEKALKIAPTDASALVGMARLHERQGSPNKAMELYQKALKANPQSGLVYNDLGLYYAEQKQVDKSLHALRKAVQLAPDNAKYRNNLARVLVDAGKVEEAYKQLTVSNSEAIAHYNIGFLLQQKGESLEAMQHLQQALHADPSLAPARALLAQIGAPGGAFPSVAPAAQVAARPTYQVSAPRGYAPQAYAPQTSAPSQIPAAQPAAEPQARPFIEVPLTETIEPATSGQSAQTGGSYHIGDDESPAARAESVSRWGGYSTGQAASGTQGVQFLPPTDE